MNLMIVCLSGCTQLGSVWQTLMESMDGHATDHGVGRDPETRPPIVEDTIEKDPEFADTSIIPAKPIQFDPPSDDPLPPPDDPPEVDPPEDDPPPPVEPPPQPYGALPESPRVEDAYFDDAVFIGDSVSLMLQYYAMAMRANTPDFLGKAQFLTAGSFSYRHAVSAVSESSIHPSYNGEKMSVEDAIAKMGAKKIYIMLGMNDVANRNYTKTLENVAALVANIQAKNPDAVFYFESVTPRTENSQASYLNNEIISGFNEKLSAYCEENSFYFVNVYEAVSDENGNLTAAYCSDPVSENGNGMGIHFTYDGCAAWVEYLYTHTA